MRTKGVILFLSLLLILSGCKKEDAKKEETPKNAIENPTENPQQPEETKPEEPEEELSFFWNDEEDFTVKIPARFLLQDKEKITTEEFDTSGTVYRFVDGEEILEISDLTYGEVEVDETLIQKEISQSETLQIVRMDPVEVDEGQFYGALIEDTVSGENFFYHRIKRQDRIISFMQIKKEAFTEEDEIENKTMLRSIRYQY